MSIHQELVSAKYIQDEAVLRETRTGSITGRTREECNRAAEGFMVWGFFAVAMSAIAIFLRASI